jgi:NADH-quinone oxidoreductase subunit C
MTQPAATAEVVPEPINPIVARVREAFGEAITRDEEINGQLVIHVDPARIADVCTLLRDDPTMRFDHLSDVTAVDFLLYNPDGGPPGQGRTPRFDVVYHLYSITHNHRVRLKAAVDEDDATLPSVTSIWPAADWAERETFDLYGIRFSGHPNLTRILTPDDWQGHPLRKDYPLIEEEIEFSKTLEGLNEPLRPVHRRSLAE